jgi:hypothetical protein
MMRCLFHLEDPRSPHTFRVANSRVNVLKALDAKQYIIFNQRVYNSDVTERAANVNKSTPILALALFVCEGVLPLLVVVEVDDPDANADVDIVDADRFCH